MKTAVITGAAGGIGYATVEKFVTEGYSVVAMDLMPAEKAAEKMAKFGDKVTYYVGDLSNGESRQGLVDTAYSVLGHVDALVNVAGVAPRQRNDILGTTEESYDWVMGINAKGTFFLTQLFANKMIEQQAQDGIRGYIVNIASMSSYTSSTNRGEYCISKAAVSMVTTLFADRLAEYGILVKEIRPGIIATGMTETVQAKYDNLIFNQGILPIKRWGQPEDIAKAVYVLCSGDLGYTTGQAIDVDGGFHIRRL